MRSTHTEMADRYDAEALSESALGEHNNAIVYGLLAISERLAQLDARLESMR